MPSLTRAGTAELSQLKKSLLSPTCWKNNFQTPRSISYGLLLTLETYTSVVYRHEAIQLHMLMCKETERGACTTKKVSESIKIHKNNVRKTNAT